MIMPQRDIFTLIEALRVRSLALTGEAWERVATRDMMNEAAQQLENLTTTYMPVPRCETCALWAPDNARGNVGVCMKARSNSLDQKMWADMYDLIKTTKDFGCVQWKEKS